MGGGSKKFFLLASLAKLSPHFQNHGAAPAPRTGLDGVNEDGNLPYGRALAYREVSEHPANFLTCAPLALQQYCDHSVRLSVRLSICMKDNSRKPIQMSTKFGRQRQWGDPLEVIKFCPWSYSGYGSSITFPLSKKLPKACESVFGPLMFYHIMTSAQLTYPDFATPRHQHNVKID